MKHFKIHFDGACDNGGNKNEMGIGVVIYDEDNFLIEAIQVYKDLEEGSSNVAEWIGCTTACQSVHYYLKNNPNCRLQIFSDSQLVTRQFNGEYQIKEEKFKKYFEDAKKWCNNVEIQWIRRDCNKEADKYSKLALKNKNSERIFFQKDYLSKNII